MGEKKFFVEVGNFILAKNSWKTDKLQKKLFFQKLWKKTEILMVFINVTIRSKLIEIYMTLNWQRLFRTVLVWHFLKPKSTDPLQPNFALKLVTSF